MTPTAPRWPYPVARALPALAAALLLALAGACSSPTSLDPIEADPGIAAGLRVVESKTQTLFAELERNAAAPFSEYDAIHYRPLLTQVTEVRKLARVHERPDAEQRALGELEATYQAMRRQHRENKLGFKDLEDYRTRLTTQLDALLRMERG